MTFFEKIRFAFKYVWVSIKLFFLGHKAIHFPNTDPIEERDNHIRQYQEALDEKILKNVSELERDGARKVLGEQTRKQAEFLWTLNHIIGVQNIDDEEYTSLKYYTLQYKTVDASTEDTPITRLTLQIIPKEAQPITRTLPLTDSMHESTSLDIMAASLHYTSESLSTILNTAKGVEKLSNDNLPVRLNITGNEIAQLTRRGCGNYIILDSKNVKSLKKKLGEIVHLTIEPKFDNIYQDTLMQYEFTLNNTTRVFSSELFDELARENGIDANMVMGYKGNNGSTDAGNYLLVADYFRYEQESNDNYKAKIVYGIGSNGDPSTKSKAEDYYKLLKVDL